MSGRLAFRLAALAFAALVILIAVVQVRRAPDKPQPAAPPTATAPRPVDVRLGQCQAKGAAGAQDPDCLKAWAEARARFLGVPAKSGR